MKKLLVFLVLVMFLVGATPNVATLTLAQEEEEETFDFNKAYQDYIFTLTEYQRDHAAYQLAKGQYLQSGTLASESEAIDATITMLQARDIVVRTYLIALRMRLSEAVGVSEAVRQGLFGRLNNDIFWYENHRIILTSVGSLEDLTDDNKETLEHFVAISEPLAYEVLTTVSVGKQVVLRNSMSEVTGNLKTFVNETRNGADYDFESVDRWVLEVENKITRSLDKEIAAQTEAARIYEERAKDRAGIFNNVVKRVTESFQFIREASTNAKETVRLIRTASD